MRRNIIVGNWKMNGALEMARSLVEEIATGVENLNSVDIVLCPPYVYLPLAAEIVKNSPSVALGAQNSSEHSSGAYTGEVSSTMLKEIGCKYVITGHSERRQYYGESDEDVAHKTNVVNAENMTPIACVGETLEERDSGQTRFVVERQVDALLRIVGRDEIEHVLIAYEPVWAIGTGKTASPEQAQEVHSWIRQSLQSANENAARSCRILYGGSVNGENAQSVLIQPDVDGCLVGGASLKSTEFLRICNAAGQE
jgi:triosephosphate isomerase